MTEKEKRLKEYLEKLDYLSNKENKTPLEEVQMAEMLLNTNRPLDALKILQTHIGVLDNNIYFNFIMGLTLKVLGNHVAAFRYLYRVFKEEEKDESKQLLAKLITECLESISLPNVYPYKKKVEKAWSDFESNFSNFQQALFIKDNKKAKDIVLNAFDSVLNIEYFEIGMEKDTLFLKFSPLARQEELYKLLYIYKLKPFIENFNFEITIDMVDFDKLPVNDEKFYLSELKYKLEEENQLLKLKIFDPFKKNNVLTLVKALSDTVLITFISDFEFVEKELDGMVLRDELIKDITEIIGKDIFDKAKKIDTTMAINKHFDFEPKYDKWLPRIDIVGQDTTFEKAFLSFLKDDDRIFENYYLNGIILGSLIFESEGKKLPDQINDLINDLVNKNIVLVSGFGFGTYFYLDLVIFDFNKFYEIVDKFFKENKDLQNLISVNYATLYQQALAKEVVRYNKEKEEEK